MIIRISTKLTGLSAAFTIAVLGCTRSDDSGRPSRVPVKGIISLNGAPLPGASVIFTPVSHSTAAAGVTDQNGRFQLKTFENNDGAVPGEFKVSIHKIEERPGGINASSDPQPALPEPKVLVPKKYLDPKTSDLMAKVESNKANEFTFEISGELPK